VRFQIPLAKCSWFAALLVALTTFPVLENFAGSAPRSLRSFAGQSPPTHGHDWRVAFDRPVTPRAWVQDMPAPGVNIFAVSANGGAEIKLTKDDRSSHPVWSPDGRRIVYSHQGNQAELWVMDADGTNQHRLALIPGFPHTVVWSPDGKNLIFDIIYFDTKIREEANYPGAIYILNLANDASPKVLTKEGLDPSWSPDGTRIAYTHISGVGSRDFKSAVCILPVDLKYGPVTLAENAQTPAWSPDGKQILYVTRANAKHKSALVVSNTDGSGARPLTNGRNDVSFPLWSPDARRIAFTSTRSIEGVLPRGPFEQMPQPFLMNADGTGLVPLGYRQLLWCNQLSWSPDGAFIAGICASSVTDPGARKQSFADSLYLLSVNHPKSKHRVLVQNLFEHAEFSPTRTTSGN
jgi:Tol biopolymer transport system component